jgi:hypothetical protein
MKKKIQIIEEFQLVAISMVAEPVDPNCKVAISGRVKKKNEKR